MKTLSFVLLFFFVSALTLQSQNVEEVTTNEDLMREHGVLNRLLLIYQEFARRIDNYEQIEVQLLANTATLVRTFIENYHEKLEEEFIFPRFRKAGKQIELVDSLEEQHMVGRILTDYILAHSKSESLKNEIQKLNLSNYLKLYIRMFRPHEAREDTILFPEFKKIISKEEYHRLGEIFEDKEHELFGEKGFEKILKQVEEIEKQLGIYNLNQFTPNASNF